MLIALFVGIVAVLMIACEILFTGRKWPQVAGWWSRAFLLNAVQLGSVYLAGIAWDGWMINP